MKTPIADFVKNYVKKDISRFHMPGHKGSGILGFEAFDITEIEGADDLGNPTGIIKESEDNASSLFGTAHSFYVTQGSTVAICAMLALVKNENSPIFAARNVHKAFINACALLGFEISWLTDGNSVSILECKVTPEALSKKLSESEKKPCAVYLTSPDYLGNIQDIKGISEVCREYKIPLIVDNAHGAYLKFLKKSIHPIDLGADICCDSAHKTLPVLTGGAYLHISENAPEDFLYNARDKLQLFSSTSPSYLTLQSLDLCNRYLSEDIKNELSKVIEKTKALKDFISERGFKIKESEPLKIVIDCAESGYTGEELSGCLRDNFIEPEFSDKDFLVLMITPKNSPRDFERLKNVFLKLTPKEKREKPSFSFSPRKALSPKEAIFRKREETDVSSALGKICASLTVSCPPAVPVVVSGEIITEEIIEILKYYGTEKIYTVSTK